MDALQQQASAHDERQDALKSSSPRQSRSGNPSTLPAGSKQDTQLSTSTPLHSDIVSTTSAIPIASLSTSPINPTLSPTLIGTVKPDPAVNDRRLFSDEVICERILKHMDWDGRYGPSPRRPFETFYFIQPMLKPQYQASQSTHSEIAVFWNDDGIEIPATAILIQSQAQKEELEAWAQKRGSGGRLCPTACLLGKKRERVHGQTLIGV